MKTKALVWDQVDKAQIPLDRLVEEYLLVCRTEGKNPKTIRGYREKLGRFCRWLNGSLGDFTLQAVRTYIGELQCPITRSNSFSANGIFKTSPAQKLTLCSRPFLFTSVVAWLNRSSERSKPTTLQPYS